MEILWDSVDSVPSRKLGPARTRSRITIVSCLYVDMLHAPTFRFSSVEGGGSAGLAGMGCPPLSECGICALYAPGSPDPILKFFIFLCGKMQFGAFEVRTI